LQVDSKDAARKTSTSATTLVFSAYVVGWMRQVISVPAWFIDSMWQYESPTFTAISVGSGEKFVPVIIIKVPPITEPDIGVYEVIVLEVLKSSEVAESFPYFAEVTSM